MTRKARCQNGNSGSGEREEERRVEAEEAEELHRCRG